MYTYCKCKWCVSKRVLIWGGGGGLRGYMYAFIHWYFCRWRHTCRFLAETVLTSSTLLIHTSETFWRGSTYMYVHFDFDTDKPTYTRTGLILRTWRGKAIFPWQRAPLWGIYKYLLGLLKGHQGKDQGQRRQLPPFPPLSIRPARTL